MIQKRLLATQHVIHKKQTPDVLLLKYIKEKIDFLIANSFNNSIIMEFILINYYGISIIIFPNIPRFSACL